LNRELFGGASVWGGECVAEFERAPGEVVAVQLEHRAAFIDEGEDGLIVVGRSRMARCSAR